MTSPSPFQESKTLIFILMVSISRSMKKRLLQLLKALAPGESIEDSTIDAELSMGEPDTFRLAAGLLSKGVPLCFTSLTGWHDSAFSRSENYWLARDRSELDVMRKMVEGELAFLQELLTGIEVASQRMESCRE